MKPWCMGDKEHEDGANENDCKVAIIIYYLLFINLVYYLLFINLGVWVTRNMRIVQIRTIARLQSLFCWATLLSKAAFMLLPRKKSLQNWVLGQLLKFTSIFLPIWRFCWVLTSVLSKKRGGAANLLLKCSDERQNKHRPSSSSQMGPPSTNTS